MSCPYNKFDGSHNWGSDGQGGTICLSCGTRG